MTNLIDVGDPATVRRGRRGRSGDHVPSAKPPGARSPARQASSAARQAKDSNGTQAETMAGTNRSGLAVLLALVAVLSLIGLVMVLSASSVESLQVYGSPWYYFEHQALWLLVGFAGFAVAFLVDYHRWRRVARPALVIAVVLLLAVLVPHVGSTAGGASRWLGVGLVKIQPSELAKLAMVLFGADLLDRRAEGSLGYQIKPLLIALVVVAALIMKQPDMGTTMVVAAICLALLFAAGAPLKILGVLGTGGVGVAGLLAVAAPYRWQRLVSFLHPFRDFQGSGYQSAEGLVAIGSGGLFGSGIGTSVASYGYLPNQQTDFIFAIISEETGLMGSLLLLGLFGALALAGVRIACRAKDRFGFLLASGITAWLIVQAVINIGSVVGVLPVVGVPLPFVSYGGSSLAVECFAVGILANVARSS